MTDQRELTRAERDLIQSLWGVGLTVVPRKGLAAFLGKAPFGVAYQWNAVAERAEWEKRGWCAVPAERHPGVFAPLGYVGEATENGLLLMEKSSKEVDAERQAARDKAHQNVADWASRAGADGLIGGARVVEKAVDMTIGVGGTQVDVENHFDTTSRTFLPPELHQHYIEILRVRDRLRADWFVANQTSTIPAEASARLMREAIETVRAKYLSKEGAEHGQSSDE